MFTLEIIEDSSNTLGLLYCGKSIVCLRIWYLHYHNQNFHQCTYPLTQHMLLQFFLIYKSIMTYEIRVFFEGAQKEVFSSIFKKT
jgi:hypothetical protein